MMHYIASNLGDREGIGDFLVKFPCLDYYTVFKNETVYIDAPERFGCLLPKRKNLIFGPHGRPTNVPYIIGHHEYHPSAGWLPKIEKFMGNFERNEPFYYPKIEIKEEILNELKHKYNFNKPIITLCKIASDENRNWNEERWNKLIDVLSKKYLCIDISSTKSHKNSIIHNTSPNSICLGDELNLLEIAHLIKMSGVFISVDSGMHHLAVASQCPKVIVLINNNDRSWCYPNELVFDVSNNNNPTEEILKEIHD